MAIDDVVNDERPIAVAEGFSRIFYALEETVWFSQVVEGPGNLSKCYTVNDPTSQEFNQVLDTDGGKVKISGAKGINRLVQYGIGMLVLAKNGVWFIRGNDSGFTATSFSVDQISNAEGCVNPESVVDAQDGVYYWGDSEITKIFTDEFGNILAQDMTENTIKSFYLDIPALSKQNCVGEYDVNTREIGWLYSLTQNNDADDFDGELIFNLNSQGWYPQEFEDSASWKIAGNFSLDIVTTGIIKRYILRDNNENYAVAILDDETTFKDFENDIPTAFLETGYETLGAPGHKKRATFAVIHMERTETGFDAQLVPLNESSCLFQAKWDWNDSSAGNRWSAEQQVYRYPRQYLPEDSSDLYDTGEKLIEFRAKVRGRGSAVSFRFSTETGKDLQIYGFTVPYSMRGKV